MARRQWMKTLGAILPAFGILLGATLPWVGYCVLVLQGEPVVAVDMPLPYEEEDLQGETVDEETKQEEKFVALTFDDGPKRSTTVPLLDGLSQRGCPATFFLIGQQIEGNEDIILRMEEEGHQIGLHTYDHSALTDLNQADFQWQVAREREQLSSLLGYDDFMLRPPYGLYDQGAQIWAEASIVLWSIDPEDWKEKTAQEIADWVLSQVGNGDIILLHDIFENSVEAAFLIVDGLLAQGYHLCTVEDLFHEFHITMETGEVYWKATQ